MDIKLPKTLFPFIWHCLKEYKHAVIIYVFLSLAAGLWGPFNSLLIKSLINLLPRVEHEDISILTLPSILIVINFIVFDNFTWRGLAYINYRFLPFLLNKIDSILLEYTLQHSYQFFQERMAGSLAKQMFNLIDGIEKIILSSARNIIKAVSLLLMAFAFAYSVSPIFFCIMFLWSILFFSISLYMSRKFIILSEDLSAKGSILAGQIIDSMSNSSSVTLFGQRNHEITRRHPELNNYTKAYQKKELYTLIMHSMQGMLIAIMMAFATYFLVRLYKNGLVTVGDFALILGLSMETGHMMWFTMSEVDEFYKAVGRVKQSLNALLQEVEIQDKPGAKALKCTQAHIVFDKVKFNYKNTEHIFEDKSLEIKATQKVGLVGYSGGGKSTFVNLILRLYDIEKGRILIDGQDISNCTLDSLRKNIAMIPQDPYLFHRSLMENIRYARLDATDQEVIEASKKAHAHEFISKLPQGYESMVGERGIKLSGGQRQRISIARAILKKAPILILDEATSQLDSLTEKEIQNTLWELMNNKTTIVIAHRLSTLLHMDRILVFDHGKVIEDGSHTELLAKGGLYKTLWNAQVSDISSDNIS